MSHDHGPDVSPPLTGADRSALTIWSMMSLPVIFNSSQPEPPTITTDSSDIMDMLSDKHEKISDLADVLIRPVQWP